MRGARLPLLLGSWGKTRKI